jgi:hypothetical protein
MKRIKRPSRRKTIGLTLCGVFLLIAAAWAGGFFLNDSSHPASISQALRRFRASGHDSGGLNGVYLYATKGSESIDALGGVKHIYPAKTSIAVIDVPCGIRLRWDALQNRSTTWTFCTTAAGIEFRVSDERHAFFGQSDHTVYTCSGRLLVPKKVVAGATRPYSCRSNQNLEVGELRVIGRGTLEVGGSRVHAIRVRSTSKNVHSHDSGSEMIDWWLASATGLPLRVELRSRAGRKEWVGVVRYKEDFSLRLLSQAPLR